MEEPRTESATPRKLASMTSLLNTHLAQMIAAERRRRAR